MTVESFEQFNEFLDIESLNKPDEFRRRALPAGLYRTQAPLQVQVIESKKNGRTYVKFVGSATAPDGSTVPISLFLDPRPLADGNYDKVFKGAAKNIREAVPEIKTTQAILDFIRDYPVDVNLRVYTKNGREENGINSIKVTS